MEHSQLRHTLIALVLDAWETETAPLGTAKTLQIQQLLRELPPDLPPQKLGSLLSPLLVNNPEEQKRFQAVFQESLEKAKLLCVEEKATEVEKPKEKAVQEAEAGIRRWRRLMLLLLGLFAFTALIGFIIWWSSPPPEKEKTLIPLGPFAVEAGDTLSKSLPDRDGDTARILHVEPGDLVATPAGNYFIVDSSGTATYIALAESPAGRRDTALAQLHYRQGIDSFLIIVSLQEPPKPPPPPDTNLIQLRPLPFPNGGPPTLKEPAPHLKLLQQYEWPLKAALLLFLGLIGWAFVRWQQYRRAKVIAEIRRADKAPYIWQPGGKKPKLHWLRDTAAPLLRRFRGRTPDEKQQLDIKGTIQATIRRAGRIQIAYKSRTLPPDYLLLIDRYSADDHQAKLFDALYQVMKEAEVPVSRYFYNGDPRLCYNKAFPSGISLVALLHRHAGARLLLIGEGMGLLAPATGRPAPWTSLLANVYNKVLFSPRPRKVWGLQERELMKLLPVLPATSQGLLVALEAFLSEEPPTQEEMLEQVRDTIIDPITFKGDLLQDLRKHYDTPQLDWIAACALWPTLSWELTLLLGEKLSEQHSTSLVSFDKLRELNRLPWFSQGRIPQPAREILLDYLAERKLERPMRMAIQEMLDKSPAPAPDSVAYEDYRMNVILNKLLLQPDPAERKKLEREFANFIAAGKKPDFVALRLLDRPAGRFDLLLNNQRLKRFAFREGLPGLGLQTGLKLAAAWALLAITLVFISPDFERCKGEPVIYDGQELCLSSPQDWMLYLEALTNDAIQDQDHQKADSLRAVADSLLPKDSAYYLNTATQYFNYGARAYNCSVTEAEDCNYPVPNDSLTALACRNFQYGAEWYQTLTGQEGVDFLLAQQRSCPQAKDIAQDEQQQAPTFFSVSGRILDGYTRIPVSGARIRLAGVDQVSPDQLARGNNSAIRQATTNEKGIFTIRELPITERLGLFVTANGYETYNRQVASSNRLADILLQPGAERLDSLRWKEAEEANTPASYQAYLQDFPNGIFASDARQIVDELTSYNENRLWEAATASDSIADYQAYLAEYPTGAYADAARRRIDAIQSAQQDDADWATAQRANTPEACQAYLDKWPQGRHREAAEACAQPPRANYVKPEMVLVRGGTFEMGDVMGDKEQDDEKVHEVTLNDFYIGKYEVTFEEYDAFCEATNRTNPDDSGWGRGRRPVIYVSWYDAVEYCIWLSEKEGLEPVYAREGENVTANWKANGYRLPTEAEWEYAARQRGQKVRFGNGKDIADPEEINFDGSEDFKKPYSKTGVYRGETIPVGSLKSPNSLGLHDMSGNVWEWCWDWYDSDYYAASASPPNDPKGPDTGSFRVRRGGSWGGNPSYVRAALRGDGYPGGSLYSVGFRLARAAR